MALKVDAETLVFAALIAVAVLAAGFFLNLSGAQIPDLVMVGKLGESLAKVLSLPFYAFILLFPLPFALVAAFAEVKAKENVYLAAAAGLVVGGFASFLLFKGIAGFAWPLTFTALSVFLFIEIISWYLHSVKSNALVRAINKGYSQVALLVAFGVFVSVAITVSANPGPYLQDFEGAVLGNQLTGAAGNAVIERNATLIVTNQRNLMDGLTSSEEYSKLHESTDPRAQAYVKKFDAKALEIGSNAYKDRVITSLKAKTTEAGPSPTQNAFEELKARTPLLAVIEKNFWLVLAILFTTLFYVIARVILRPLLIIYIIVLDKALQFAYTQLLVSQASDGGIPPEEPLQARPEEGTDPESRWRWF